MRELARRLEENVLQEIEQQRTLGALLDRQISLLVDGGSDQLGPLLEELETGAATSRALEQERVQLLEELALSLGCGREEVTLDGVVRHLGAEGDSLGQSGSQLREVLTRVREAHRKATLLIRHSSEFVSAVLGAVRPSNTDAVTYDDRGQLAPRSSQAFAAEG